MQNPLLQKWSLPPFSKIKLEHMLIAIEATLKHCYSIIDQINNEKNFPTWDNTCQVFEEINDDLYSIFGIIEHLHAVKNSKPLRKIYQKSLILISNYHNFIYQNKILYKRFLLLKNSVNCYNMLNIAQKKVLNNVLDNFKLSGIDLLEKEKILYKKIYKDIINYENIYENNVMDSTKSWKKLILDKKLLSGLSSDTINQIELQAKKINEKGWLLTLDTQIYHQIINNCDNERLRKEIYYFYSIRASDEKLNDSKWNNSKIIIKIISLRHKLSQLTGFQSYAERSLSKKMIKNVTVATNFLYELAKKSKEKAKKEVNELLKFCRNRYSSQIKFLHPWNFYYFSEKRKKYMYGLNDEEYRPYFQEKYVIQGFFEILYRIYGIFIQEKKVETWNNDIRFFQVFDKKNKIGGFYLDLYTRKNKRNGAWMNECISMMRKKDMSVKKPIAYVVCNFSKPMIGKKSLLNHHEIITLFHELGHAFHHILTKIEISSISGIKNVPWDVVELPSQIMEYWCWEPEVLKLISKHYKTGKSLPDSFICNLIKSKNYNSALFILRQVELSLFDLLIHNTFIPDNINQVIELFENIKKEITILPIPSWTRFMHSFTHIFSGGYGAGYYSYLWSNMLAANAYARFVKEGIFNRKTGEDFIKNFLQKGGSENPKTMLEKFIGKTPNINQMLKYYGII
ncbi:M3 family metallopeptidase [Candidatus Tachikawaea gelatinosa]|uniref:oligopeptidase A n=1 Tax=Candidatus Tachikawaea gelatinosa TaxID=1410383 RepID=A0A090AQ25_9ENTR|nr:M3 family metallopeptidase [Candidatus Tachikawaea gelatinosa]BAP58422.1 oligopeptidase A [Candidatus Tachikawaea gelatinosa]